MNVEQLLERLAAGGEQRNFELKGPLSLSEKVVQAKIARAVLGMANHRDGGHIVIGIDETVDETGFPRYDMRGLDAAALASWSQDNVRARMAEYADPHVEVDVFHLDVGEVAIVVLRVHEFSETPVLARREAAQADGKRIVRKSALYVRGRGKVESVEAPTSGEMRDVIDLAVEKRLRSFIATAGRAGMTLRGEESATSKYDLELGQEFDEIAEQVRTRGHWEIRIAPSDYREIREQDISEVERLARTLPVTLRGWNFPAYLADRTIKREMRWVGQSHRFEHHIQSFRLYQSGQFWFVGGLWHDWRDVSTRWKAPDGWKPGQIIDMGEIVGRTAEIFEFASRLSLSSLGAERTLIEIALVGLEGRTLAMDIPNKLPLFGDHVAHLPRYEHRASLSREELVDKRISLGHDVAVDVLRRFGYNADRALIASMWEKIAVF